jgi:protein-S-isoprenylcysteine O-methyltransferase Ste14
MNKRLLWARIFSFSVIGLIFVSQNHYPANSGFVFFLKSLGFVLLVAAGIGRIWSAAHIAGSKNVRIVQEGPYSISRNPLYFFSFLGFIGGGLAFGSLLIAVLLLLVFLLTHGPTILKEEQFLRDKFGDEFRAFEASTPRFFPAFWKLKNPEQACFNPAAFNKAVREATLIILSFGLITLIDAAHTQGWLPVLFRVF